jgi:NADPH2:quinone reductase
MRVTAARLVQHGQPLQVEELELGEPGDQEVILDVAYSGVNPVDMYGAQGLVAPDAPVPRTLGTEGAGIVEGRRVMVRGYGLGTIRDGLWASAAIVPRGALIAVPDGVDLRAAAAMGIAGVTAWRTVTEVAQVSADDTVLVLGAKGGVGSIVLSLASGIGATVVGQTGEAENLEWIKAHGADYAVVTDAEGLAEALADLRPTVVFDALGGGFTGAAVEALQPYGRLVLYGASAGPEGLVPLRTLYRKSITIRSYAGLMASDEDLAAAIRQALPAVAAGRMTVPIDAAIPLKQANDAFERIRQRSVRGKLVLDAQS